MNFKRVGNIFSTVQDEKSFAKKSQIFLTMMGENKHEHTAEPDNGLQ